MSLHYCIDTSALMTWYIRRYPPDVFPSVLPKMEGLVSFGRLHASEYVLSELGAKKDPIYDWANAQSGLFIKTDSAVLAKAWQLIATYPLLVDPSGLKAVQADPYVVALGVTNNWVVVTQETYAKTKLSGKRKQRTYIPDVCSAENIRCIDFLEMMRQEKWAF